MKLQKILKNLPLVFILLNISTHILAKNRINISAEMGVGLAHSRQWQTGENQESIGNQLNAKEIEIEARNGNLIATQTDFTSRDWIITSRAQVASRVQAVAHALVAIQNPVADLIQVVDRNAR